LASERERKLTWLVAGLGAVVICLSLVLFVFVKTEREAEPDEATEPPARDLPAEAPTAFPDPGPASWTPFASSEGRYSIDMPGPTTRESNTETTDIGDVEVITQWAGNDSRYCAVSYGDYPTEFMREANPEQFIDGVVEAMSADPSSRLTERREFLLQGYPARRVRIEVPGDRVMTAVVCLVGARLYTVTIVTSPEEALSELVDHYVESFRLQAEGQVL